jgi:hypothetical protein
VTPDLQTRLLARGRWVPFALLAVMMVASAIVFLHAARGTTFFLDDWNFVETRHEWTLDAFLEPHNEHFSLVPVAVYKLLFVTFGLDDYRLYRGTAIVFHLACVGVVYAFARRRVGDWTALGLVAPLLFLATSWLDIAWPFQIGFLASITFGVGALMAAERGTRAGDLAACGLLILSLCSSGTGVPFVLAVGLMLISQTAWRARLWVVAAPVALYALWYVVYGRSAARSDNIDALPAYVVNAGAGAAGSLSGLGPDWGQVIFVLIGVGVAFVWMRAPRRLDPLVPLIVIALSFWALTALARAQLQEPGAMRYLYPGAVFLILILAELMGRHGAASWDAGRIAAVWTFGALFVIANTSALPGVEVFRAESADARAATAAIEIAAPVGAPDVVVDDFQPQIRPPLYLAAVDALDSSPAYSQRELETATTTSRLAADEALLRIYRPRPEPVPAGTGLGAPPAVAAVTGAAQRVRGACVTLVAAAPTVRADLELPAAGVSIAPVGAGDAVHLRLRRFADTFVPREIGTVTGRAAVRLPADRSPRPWHLHVRRSGSLKACGLGPAAP